ncbi:MAG: O-antigen ligase family protein, partial [Flavobacteriales bacterium]|nr:O-antigen ligase family protein [Flavobacteriales bacterium]
LSPKELRTILLLFAWSAVVGSLIGYGITLETAAPGAYRERSPFISHIRLGLMLVLAVVVLLHHWPRSWWKRIGHLLGVAACLSLLRELGSLQGFLLVFLLAWVAVWWRSQSMSVLSRWGVRAVLLVPVLVLLLQVRGSLEARRSPRHFHPGPISAGGELYWNDSTAWQVENGHPVWVEVAPIELGRSWRARTGTRLTGSAANGESLYGTLVRYMASKHLTKDSVGMLAMTDEDLQRVQQGFVNVEQGRQGPLRRRIDEVVYEMERFHNTSDASSGSVAMRLEYWRTGLYLARENWLGGVGTGDTQQAFDRAYEELGSTLDPEWRHRAHQQYLTLWISFGVLGFLFAMSSWVVPAVMTGGWRHPVYLAFALVFVVSCLTDDTLETQPGATFYAFFQALFLFAVRRKAD